MKKLLCCLLSMAIMLSIAMFPACSVIGDTIHVRYGEKYLLEGVVGEAEEYYIFYKDGTAKYRHYYHDYSKTYDIHTYRVYTLSLTYEIVDEDTVVCFYAGIEYDKLDNRKGVGEDWTQTILCSKNVIMTATKGDVYIAEPYLEEIPNFNK